MNHTVRFAAGLNLVVLDDGGSPVDALFVPFTDLLFVYLPAGLYALLRRVLFGALALLAALGSANRRLSREIEQWRVDLRFIAYCALSIFYPPLEEAYYARYG